MSDLKFTLSNITFLPKQFVRVLKNISSDLNIDSREPAHAECFGNAFFKSSEEFLMRKISYNTNHGGAWDMLPPPAPNAPKKIMVACLTSYILMELFS